MVIHRDQNLVGAPGFSCNCTDIEEWHTRDLFQPHPIKPNLLTLALELMILSDPMEKSSIAFRAKPSF